jgi:hypothetical protein
MDTHEAKLTTALSRWFQEENLRETVFDAAWPQSFFQSVHDSRVVHLALADRQVIPHAWLGLTLIIDIGRRLSYDPRASGGLTHSADNDCDGA